MRITANAEDVGHPIPMSQMRREQWYREYNDPDEDTPEYDRYYMRPCHEPFVRKPGGGNLARTAIRVYYEKGGGVEIVECDDNTFVFPCPPGFQITLANDPPPAVEEEEECQPPKKNYARKGKGKIKKRDIDDEDDE